MIPQMFKYNMKMKLRFFLSPLNLIFKAVKQRKGQGINGWRSGEQPCRSSTTLALAPASS